MPTPLLEDLQAKKISLQEFHDVTLRALDHMSNVVSYEVEEKGYLIKSSTSSGTTKYVRPIQKKLFIFDKASFSKEFKKFIDILLKIKEDHKNKTEKVKFKPKTNHHDTINSVVYTIQQSIGAGLDLLGEPNSNRKHVGNRFEELLRLITSEIGITNKKVVFNIPYKVDKKTKYYKSETDMIISPFDKIKSKPRNLHPREVVVSAKTSSKDRMPKTFVDKMLLQKFSGEDKIKVAGIFLNDVQMDIPLDSGHRFRSISATYSAPFRPPIPLHSGHLFRSISATL